MSFLSSAHGAEIGSTAGLDAGETGSGPEIRVTGRTQDTANPKLVAPVIDTPKSIVTIPETLIRDTGSASLVEALRTVPGITFGAAEGGNPIGDRPFIRGFDSQGSSYLDGVRDVGAQTREIFAVDQVQVIKGSDSTLGGRGSAGGTINIVSKLPKLDSFATFDGSYGNADYKRVTGDVNVQLGPTAAIRIEALWHDQDVAGRDAIWQRRWGVAPSATIGLGTPTRLTAAYYHLHSDELPDSGVPYAYVCTATLCNAPAGSRVLSEPVHGQVTTLGGTTGNVPHSAFYGLADRDFRKTNGDQATLRVEHDFGGHVTIRNTSRYGHSWQGYIFTLPDDSQGNVTGTTLANAAGQYTSGGYVWRRANTRVGRTDSLTNQTDLTARFRTGHLKHSLAAGIEFSSEDARRGTYVVASGSTISPRCSDASLARYACTSLFTPNPSDPWVNYASDTSGVPTPITRSPSWGDTVNKGITRAAYLFDSVEIGHSLIVNLGIRHDDFTSTVRPPLTSPTAAPVTIERRDRSWNYQAGLVAKPTRDLSVYGSVATSTTPPNSLLGEGLEANSLGTSLSATLDQLKPEKTKSYEIGAKANLLDGKLLLTLAIFRTESTNSRVQIDANTVAFIGKKRADGIEIGFNGRITDRWQLFGGYSYLDARIREGGFSALTALAVGTQAAKTVYVPSVNTGKPFPQTAKHSFTAWSDYSLGKVTLGGGAFYMSRVYGGYSDNRKAVQDAAGNVTIIPATTILYRSVPGYWRFDARASYRISPHMQISVNANDLTDKRYFAQAYSNHYATPAAGRTVFGTLSLSY